MIAIVVVLHGLGAQAAVAPAQAPATLDRIIAVVNGDLVTQSDVRAARLLRLVPDGSDADIAIALIERRLIVAELRRFQIPAIDADALAARREQWRSSLGDVDVDALLASAGVAQWFVDRWLSDDVRYERYVAQRFATLAADRRGDAVRAWIDGLRARAQIVYR